MVRCSRFQPHTLVAGVLAAGVLLLAPLRGEGARAETLAEPLPAPAPNAALHYQRALLHLATLPRAEQVVLDRPLWALTSGTAGGGLSSQLEDVLVRAVPAMRAASLGSRQAVCDFGLDFSVDGPDTELPHVRPMVRLARVLLLRAAHAESRMEMGEAAVVYFDVLRLGRHLTHQHTLIEALAGLQVLEEACYGLARWAVACPERTLVARAFGLLESLTPGLTQPSRTIARESAILRHQFDQFLAAFPDGPWAEMVLAAVGADATSLEPEAARGKAIELASNAGIPESTFASRDALARYLASLRKLDIRFTEAAAACLTLPAGEAIKRGRGIYERYTRRLGALGAQVVLDPAEVARAFAHHDATLTLCRVALALSASRGDGGFPASLDDVAARFGGVLPASPYDGQSLTYVPTGDRSTFSLGVPAAKDAALGLPGIDFHARPPSRVARGEEGPR